VDVCAKMAKPIEMPFGFWTRMARRNCVRWDSRGAEGRCHGNQFWDAVCYNWLSMGYNFGCMVTSNTLFHSTGGFSGSSYPMKTWQRSSVEGSLLRQPVLGLKLLLSGFV